MIHFILNDKTIATDLPPGMVILDFIRYQQHLTGTKIGCREGDCGACTVLAGELTGGVLHYQSMTSCLLAIGNAHGKHIVTIEGINMEILNPIQQAMVDEGATQCGFCTPGFVVSLAGYCLQHEQESTTAKAIAAIDGNICRCTGYKSIEKAAAKVATLLKKRKEEDPIAFATGEKILPLYFSGIKQRLFELQASAKKRVLPDLASLEKRPRILGGGTDLYVQQHGEMTDADIHFLFDHPELIEIRKEGSHCIIGPSVTVSDLLASAIIREAFVHFQGYAKLVSSTPIRNMATLAGNFINASPIGDFTIFFLALDAQLLLSDGTTKRKLALRKLYTGYKTLAKTPEEHIEQIQFELPDKNTLFHFEKVSKRTHLDIASVNTAIQLHVKGGTITKAGLSAGGVGPVPVYLQKTVDFLQGKKVSEKLVQEAIAVMQTEIAPVSDARGTKEYKALLLGQLIKAHFMKLFPGVATNGTNVTKKDN